MWYHPTAFAVGVRDVIGAWLVCLAVAAVFFGSEAFGYIGDPATLRGDASVNASMRTECDQAHSSAWLIATLLRRAP